MENGGYGIGHRQLNDAEKTAYRIFSKVLERGAAAVDCSAVDRSVDLLRVFQTAMGNHPEILYFDRTQVRQVTGWGGRRLQLRGCRAPGQVRRMTGELASALEDAAAYIRHRSPLGELDILTCAAEFLQRHVAYDEKEAARFPNGGSGDADSHSAYGALVKGLAVCDGIAAALALIAQSFRIPVMMVFGKAVSPPGGPVDHAWNIVEIDRRFFHVDATWDINLHALEGEFSYEYLCLEDDDLLGDHMWDIRTTPPCGSARGGYYAATGHFANNMTQVEDIFRRDIRQGARVIRVKVSRNIAVPEPADRTLADRLLHTAAAGGRAAEIRFRWNENTRCFFARFV